MVIGLVAMHQMAGGAHRMAAAAAPAPGTTVMTASDTAPMASMGLVAPVPDQDRSEAVPLPTAGPVTGPASRAAALLLAPAHAVATGTAALCLAVLLGLLVVATLRSTGSRRPRVGAAPVAARPDSAPLGRGPPRLLLARLCVLRT